MTQPDTRTEPEMVPSSQRPTYYLATHPYSGQALFSRDDKARQWCDEQNRYHFSNAGDVRWVDGGEHGWQAQRWVRPEDLAEYGHELATVSRLKLDDRLPDWTGEAWSWDAD